MPMTDVLTQRLSERELNVCSTLHTSNEGNLHNYGTAEIMLRAAILRF